MSESSTEINVLSGGAVEPGLRKVVDAFRRATARRASVAFATAPEIRKRLAGKEPADVVIAPADLVRELARQGKLRETERATVGRVGIGVTVREGAELPGIATVEQFKDSLLQAEAVVYNQASTGIYLERLFQRLGIAEKLQRKAKRYPDAAGVLDRVARGTGREIGLAAATVIVQAKRAGLKFVGPLPAEIQNYTVYEAAVTAAAKSVENAREFVRFLASPEAKAEFSAAGIE
ncbi:MAG TPA: substrate-binding domain-containing protein [Candidatus Acidoferrales bacterium]|nr:substrate-binding domain-containing protein [Candidatus Acidoferrales bacterium]